MLDFLSLNKTFPDRQQHPNCFSWFWSLASFSKKTRALWNPLNIDPALSDPEDDKDAVFGCQMGGLSGFERRLKEGSNGSNKFSFENERIKGDCSKLNGKSVASGKSFGSEAMLKISRISEKRSRSANSHIRDWHELMQNIGKTSSRMEPTQETSYDLKIKENSANGTTRESLKQEQEKKIIKCKMLPKNRGFQMHIMDLLVKSIDIRQNGQSGRKSLSESCNDLAGKDALIWSDHSGHAKQLKKDAFEIGNTSNYSFASETKKIEQKRQIRLGVRRKMSQSQETTKSKRNVGEISEEGTKGKKRGNAGVSM